MAPLLALDSNVILVTGSEQMKERIEAQMVEAWGKALDALAGYKFWMFGYHAAAWVKYNQLLDKPDRQPNPFRFLVKAAKEAR